MVSLLWQSQSYQHKGPLRINDSSSKSGLLVLWLACFVAHQQPQLLSYNTYFATSMTMQLLPSEPVMLAGQDM
jgi:hypothetical protein